MGLLEVVAHTRASSSRLPDYERVDCSLVVFRTAGRIVLNLQSNCGCSVH